MLPNMRPVPSVRWDTAHMDGENIIIHLAAHDPRLHILVLPREVLEDAVRASGGDLIRLAHGNRRAVEAASQSAWQRDDLREVFEVTGPRRNVQLWLTLEDFGTLH